MPRKLLLLLLYLICQAGLCAEVSVGDAPHRGTLYRVRYHGISSYLFGTIHVGKDSFFPLEPEVTRALARAKNLVIELDIRNAAPSQLAFDKYALYRNGDSLGRHLSGATLIKMDLALDKAGISRAAVSSYKPWLVANLLVGLELTHQGFQRSQAVEYFLLAAAGKKDRKVLELESADYQMSLFDSMNDAQQEDYLLENLADLADGNSLKKSQDLIDAWSTADSAKINLLLQELTTGNSVSSNFMRITLLGKRNPEMATTIENIIKDDQVAFVGVGLLHLIGANGVPRLLMQRGYDVEKVY